MSEWKMGDKHPDAPWTVNGVPITCPTCGGLSKQGLGVEAICVGADAAYCEEHFDQNRKETAWI